MVTGCSDTPPPNAPGVAANVNKTYTKEEAHNAVPRRNGSGAPPPSAGTDTGETGK